MPTDIVSSPEAFIPPKGSRWLHYKGDVCVIRDSSKDSETKEIRVEYIHGGNWSRLLRMWHEPVKVRTPTIGVFAEVRRFTRIDEHVSTEAFTVICDLLSQGTEHDRVCFLCGEVCQNNNGWIHCRHHGNIRIAEYKDRYEWMRVFSIARHPDAAQVLDAMKPDAAWDAAALKKLGVLK